MSAPAARASRRALAALLLAAGCRAAPVVAPPPVAAAPAADAAPAQPDVRWYRGNTHTHTLWSDGGGAHVNALNVVAAIPEQTGATLVAIVRHDLAAAAGQAMGARQPMLAVLNHPNFLWSQTAEDLLAMPELRAFEVSNGHPLVHSRGDSPHAGTERIWDVVLTRRARRGEPPLWGLATDDAHDYHRTGPERRNAGRGWMMVRAGALDADSLRAAMAHGDEPYVRARVVSSKAKANPSHAGEVEMAWTQAVMGPAARAVRP